MVLKITKILGIGIICLFAIGLAAEAGIKLIIGLLMVAFWGLVLMGLWGICAFLYEKLKKS